MAGLQLQDAAISTVLFVEKVETNLPVQSQSASPSWRNGRICKLAVESKRREMGSCESMCLCFRLTLPGLQIATSLSRENVAIRSDFHSLSDSPEKLHEKNTQHRPRSRGDRDLARAKSPRPARQGKERPLVRPVETFQGPHPSHS